LYDHVEEALESAREGGCVLPLGVDLAGGENYPTEGKVFGVAIRGQKTLPKKMNQASVIKKVQSGRNAPGKNTDLRLVEQDLPD